MNFYRPPCGKALPFRKEILKPSADSNVYEYEL